MKPQEETKVVTLTSDSPVPPAPETEFHWGRRQVHALIGKVEEFFEDFYDGTKKKKFIWNAVAERMQEEGHNCTGSECDKKWRNLKGTYVKVLQKQIHGDSSYRFEYFDALHHILGKEIDPLGMREQAMTRVAPSPSDKMSSTEYQDLTFDILQEIAQQMAYEGQEVQSEQCQSKWLNLQEGFQHHQAKAEATGSVSLWTFFTRVRDVVNSLNVVTDSHRKPVLGPGGALGPTKGRHRGITGTRRSTKGGENLGNGDNSILDRVRQLETSLTINRRLQHLESKVESGRWQSDAYKQTNNVLSQILSELRRINNFLEQDQNQQPKHEIQQTITQHQQDQGPSSPNQGIIIVEAYADQL
ncbi:putative Myb/SANT-like DNA-binding domain-containing protein 25 [Homarus americanus]|uniref:Putative Myb/SANT-like DNA-binding domain-containing protein 25 n=1 Tax=Homarus americanus TaxID=6706 RepID=A0A8J5MUI8_HOMAM|nr:putative Myb/SANT-like DNA-binding domain-containing protein 25 [Homarus americanus]